jgi:clostripain
MPCSPAQLEAALSPNKKVTVICYMNGDNNLAGEVLYAVDMMETVGSSRDVDIIALVDGRPGENGGYGSEWEQTKLLHITKDDEIGVINSRVIANMGEQNLGDPRVLEEFIRTSLQYPSDKYVFILFSHGRGIIDTKSFAGHRDYKSALLSPDETGQRAMNNLEFTQAIKNGLSGERFHLMLFFSCLTNMVEVGYGLQEVTDYMIGSADEIRMVNTPPGMYQIRGIEPEKLIDSLSANPDVPALEMGKVTIDSFVSQYEADIYIEHGDGSGSTVRYPATLALVNCQMYDKLSRSMDTLSRYLIEKITHKESAKVVLRNLSSALDASQKYPSFLNLEYIDLRDILENLRSSSEDAHIRQLCQECINILENELILYERHTDDSRSHGVSVFFPTVLVPENIYRSHMSMYRNSRFSRDTSWGELIDIYRGQMLENRAELLIDEYEQAWENSDSMAMRRLYPRLSRELYKDLANGKYRSIKRYLGILESIDKAAIPLGFVHQLNEALRRPGNNHQADGDLLETAESLLQPGAMTVH